MFSVVCDKDIKPESIKSGEKIYLDTTHFLPFTRFIQKKGEKGANKGGNFNRGGRGGKGRGGPQRGGGGYRPPRGGSSGGYRPPRKQGK